MKAFLAAYFVLPVVMVGILACGTDSASSASPGLPTRGPNFYPWDKIPTGAPIAYMRAPIKPRWTLNLLDRRHAHPGSLVIVSRVGAFRVDYLRHLITERRPLLPPP